MKFDPEIAVLLAGCAALVGGREACEHLRSVWASYLGHFSHANSYRLVRRIFDRFPWLANRETERHG